MKRWVLIGLVALAGCCTSPACLPENLPHGGKPHDSAELFDLIQYAARNDCCEQLYEQLTQASRDEYSETAFCLAWEGIELPDYGYYLVDVVIGGSLIGSFPGNEPGEEFLYIEFEEPGRENLLARILLKQETDSSGLTRPFLAMIEQKEHIEAGQAAYHWDGK
ncbi:MAG: hypothetical protein R3F62_22605 [Planctomycetota bacterium]